LQGDTVARLPGISRKQIFYELLEKQAQAAVDAASEFQFLVNDFANLDGLVTTALRQGSPELVEGLRTNGAILTY
jgi:hypothetical protein